jgi:putative ABC transport system permease protein
MAAADRALAQEGHDVEVFLQRPGPSAELEAIAAKEPEAGIVEAWRRASVSIDEPQRFTLAGYPEASRLFQLPVVEGTAPREKGDVLVTKALRDVQPDLALGKTVTVRFRDRKEPVRIVGFVEQIGAPVMYASFPTFEAVTALGDAAYSVRVKGRTDALDLLADRLDQAFLDAGRAPAQVISKRLVRDSLDEHVGVVGGVMRAVALAAALVGAIVLVATVIFNVSERRREVGILRSLGAMASQIRGIFTVEATAIAVAACALAIALALFLTRLMLDAAERTLLRVTVPTQFSLAGLAILAAGAIVVMIAVRVALARALKAPARDALAAD